MARDWEDIQVVTDADTLMKLVRAGRVEILLASKLNGLGRSVSQLVQLLRDFVEHQVTLIIPSEGINTSSVLGKVFLDALDAIAEFKRSVAVERINSGMPAAKARGVKLGRPVTIDAHREDVARLRAQGRTGRAIAKELGLPSSNVFRILKRAAPVV